MSSSLHTVARDGLVAAWSDPSVASVAGIATAYWPARVLKGDKDGFVSELHRGRLPAVEVFQVDDEWKALGDVDLGIVTSEWGIRVHVAGQNQVQEEETARAIAYAGLIVARANPYFKIGGERVVTKGTGPMGYSIEITFQLINTMDRATYETTVSSGSGDPSDGGAVGGIKVDLNFNAASPVAVLALPAGQAIDNVELIVNTAFDDASATATIGIDGAQDTLLLATDSELYTANSAWERSSDMVGPATIKVWITPGVSTQGNFTVQISTTLAP